MAVTIYMLSDKKREFNSLVDEIVGSMSVPVVYQIKRNFKNIKVS